MVVYNDLFEMIRLMRDHRAQHGLPILTQDDPIRRVVGFVSGEEVWEASLSALKRALPRSHREDLLRELLSSPDGRQRLARMIEASDAELLELFPG